LKRIEPDALAQRFSGLIASFPHQLKVLLLRILDMADEERAAAIGQMFQDGSLLSVAELLMDLEESASLRKVSRGGDPQPGSAYLSFDPKP
jgi:hypothetical protein